jgi:hypothetical protein
MVLSYKYHEDFQDARHFPVVKMPRPVGGEIHVGNGLSGKRAVDHLMSGSQNGASPFC